MPESTDYDQRTRSVPEEYKKMYRQLFEEELETGLPEHGKWDHEIPLKEGCEPSYQQIYALDEAKLKVLDEYLRENLKKGYIRGSTSPAGHPILFVPKKNGKLRLCVDYRKLNEITIKDRYPLPLIHELKDRFRGARWFTKLDLKGAYNLIRIKAGEEWKTAFRTRYGHYEYLVMPFGLTNAPASFQRMINEVLRQETDNFVVVYLDDIVIYSRTLEDNKRHTHQVLQKLLNAKLLVEPEKSQFHVQEITFLGFVIRPGEIGMEPEKITAVRDWPTPRSVKEVRSFIGFTNFYRTFIKGYGEIASPLYDLTKKNVPFEWADKHEKAFQTLRQRVTESPVLREADPDKPFEVETDASGFAMGAQLGQRDENDKLHPIAFYSAKFHGPELNYPIYDKELLAIINSFKEWRVYLQGAKHQVEVFSDHKNLVHFTNAQSLSGRHARWLMILSEYDFRISYRKGSQNGKADALSRRADYEEEQPIPEEKAFLRWNDNQLELAAAIRMIPDEEWTKKLEKAESQEQTVDYKVRPGRRFLPPGLQEETIRRIHESSLGGHQGISKTLHKVQEIYDGPGLLKSTKTVIENCNLCNKAKTKRHKPYGLLQPLPAPTRPWQSIAWDLITDLPPSRDPISGRMYDSILNIICRLTKEARFLPFSKSHTPEDLAEVFIRHVVSETGMPEEVVSDRGTTFTSRFWQGLMKNIGVKHKLSTAYHPQTDGQTERTNQTLEQYLRCFINLKQDDWAAWLPLAQLAYNTAPTDGTKITPFWANRGLDPFHPDKIRATNNPAALIKADEMRQIHEQLSHELEFVRTRMAHYANKKRLKGPIFTEGEKVYLVRSNIKTTRPNSKLDFKKHGPFKIKEKKSEVVYELELPKGSRLHPRFHVSLLEPAPQHLPIQKEFKTLEEEEYEVEKIIGERTQGDEWQYLVKWKGYDNTENTWEPVGHLKNARLTLERWLKKKDTTNVPRKQPRGS